MIDLDTKMEKASAKMYAWNEGYNAGYLHGISAVTQQNPQKPKNPWSLLIFRHYCKRWERGER